MMSATATVLRPIYLICATYLTMSAVWTVLITLVRFPMGEPHWTAPLKACLFAGGVIMVWQESARRVLQGTWCSYAVAQISFLSVLFSPIIIWFGSSIAAAVLYAVLAGVWLVGLSSLVRGLRELP